jgi:hypothetical protein
MAIRQLVPIEITLLGDGSSTTFVFPAQNLWQNGTGGSNPPVANGTVPTAVQVPNPPIAITSSTVDADGNITITFTAAPTNGVQYTMEVDLLFPSGAITSTSATPVPPVNIWANGTALTQTGGSLNVNITGGSSGNPSVGTTGTAAPTSATEIGIIVSGNLVGVSSSNPMPIAGIKTNNNAAPGANNDGVLPAIVAPSNTTYPTYAAGNQVALVTDLAGNTNVDLQYWGGSDLGAAANFGTTPGAVIAGSVNASLFAGTTALSQTGGSLNVDVTNTVVVSGSLTNNNAAPAAINVGVLGSVASATPQVATQGNLVTTTTDLQGNLRVAFSGKDTDALGTVVVQTRDAQWQVNNSLGPDSTNITPTLTGSGTISYTAFPGAVTLSTTAVASSGANLLSTTTLDYQIVFEWFCYFTVGFPSVTGAVGSQVGAAGSHQRIGLYNGAPTDGFFVGFEGGSSFGITQFQNGVGQGSFSANSAVGIPIASFNGDKCSGTAGSAFTSGGSPIAIDFTKMNLFRIRGAWLGVGLVMLEVACPDGSWVTMHTFRNPNSLTQPYTATNNFNWQVDLQNTTNATNLQMVMGGAAFGTDASLGETRITDPLTNTAIVPTVRSAVWGQYNSSAPTATSGQYTALQTDANANLRVSPASYVGAGYPINIDGSTSFANLLVIDRPAVDLLNQVRDDLDVLTDQLYDGTFAVQIQAGTNLLGSTYVSGLAGNALNTRAVPSPNTIRTGQQAVTTTATALPSNYLTNGITVEAKSTNTAVIYVGGPGITTTTGLELPAGAAVTLQVANSNAIYVIAAATGQTVTWLAY